LLDDFILCGALSHSGTVRELFAVNGLVLCSPAWAITDFMSFFGISPLLFKIHIKRINTNMDEN
jgi:hypothetical protein